MAEPNYSFRAALHGFNRSDVITYLSELAAAHAAQLEEKDAQILSVQNENTRLKQELMCMRVLIGSEPKAEPTPAKEPESVEEAAPVEEAEPIEEAAPVEEPVPVEEAAPAEEPEPADDTPEASSMKEQELEAYRRAERCEREARQRADKIYVEACAAVESAKLRLNEQEGQLDEMSASLAESMNSLQDMMAQIRTHLGQTRACMQEMEDSLQSTNE